MSRFIIVLIYVFLVFNEVIISIQVLYVEKEGILQRLSIFFVFFCVMGGFIEVLKEKSIVVEDDKVMIKK